MTMHGQNNLNRQVMVIYLLTLHISIVDQSNQRSGWSSLVVVQPSTGHQLLCVQCVSVCVCVLLCPVFIIAVRLGNKVIFYQLSPLTLQVTVNSALSHRPFQIPLCQRSAIFSKQQSPTVCSSC